MSLFCRWDVGSNAAQWFSKLFSPQKPGNLLGSCLGFEAPQNNSVRNYSGLFSQGSQVILSQLRG